MIRGDWLGITSNERTEEMSFGQGLQHSRSFPMPISTIYWTVDLTWRTASCQNSVVTCTFDGNMKIIPLDDMFIAHQYKLKHETRKDKDWDIKMILHRKNGTTLTYHFQRSSCDFVGEFLYDTVICLELHEMKDEIPCLLLMCAETQSIMTKIHRKDRFKLMHIVTITEDDNLMSNFGRTKWRRCIRSASDCVFFAGPCTGGSPWNRLNKTSAMSLLTTFV